MIFHSLENPFNFFPLLTLTLGQPTSESIVLKWLSSCIPHCCFSVKLSLEGQIRAHSTRAIAAMVISFRSFFPLEIFRGGTCSSFSTFTKHYCLLVVLCNEFEFGFTIFINLQFLIFNIYLVFTLDLRFSLLQKYLSLLMFFDIKFYWLNLLASS